jgi:hypothetical protein
LDAEDHRRVGGGVLALVWKTSRFTIEPPDYYERAELSWISRHSDEQISARSFAFGGLNAVLVLCRA